MYIGQMPQIAIFLFYNMQPTGFQQVVLQLQEFQNKMIIFLWQNKLKNNSNNFVRKTFIIRTAVIDAT